MIPFTSWKRPATLCCSLMIGAAGLTDAAELTPLMDHSQHLDQPGRTLMTNQNGPNRSLSTWTGLVINYDEVLSRLTVRDGQGVAMDFMLDTNTTAVDHNRQIHLTEIHIGDRVTVFFNTEPRIVNRIERN